MRKTIGTFAISAAALLIACGSAEDRTGFKDSPQTGLTGDKDGKGNGGVGGDNGGALGNGETVEAPPEKTECEKMDIVFIVDDSASMSEEQSNLATNFPKFIDKINTFKTKGGSKLDWRIAITTTSRNIKYNVTPPFGGGPSIPMSEKGDDGAFRMKKECGNKRWIEKADADAEKNFSCLAKTGTGGSGLEMPLYATELALVDRVADGTNQGFLRDDALLAVVILTDEDDCSRKDNNFSVGTDACAGTAPVSEFKSQLDGIAKGAGRWATAVIAGETACKSSFGDAVEASRLKEFVGLAGKNGTFASICDGDLTPALEKALDTFDAACKVFPPKEVK